MKPLNQWTSADIIGFAKGVDKKTWIGILSGIAGFVLVLIFLILPAWIERPMLRREVESMEAQIRQVNALSDKRRVWEENQKIFGSLISDTQGRVFTAEDASVLLGVISKMASEFRVDVLFSKPLDEKVVFSAPYNMKYRPSGYEFTVQGGYHDLGKFTSRMEGYEKLLRIRSLQIRPSDKTPERHIAELKLWAIVAVPPGEVAAAPVEGGKKRAKK